MRKCNFAIVCIRGVPFGFIEASLCCCFAGALAAAVAAWSAVAASDTLILLLCRYIGIDER